MLEEVWSFFWPNRYNVVEIILNDNHVHRRIVKIPEDLRYEYNDTKYEMFERQLRIPMPGGGSVVKKNTVVYRDGRLNKFYFKEGNPSAIDMRELEFGENLNIRGSIDKKDIDNLWVEPKLPIQQIWDILKPVLIIIGIAIVVYYIFTNTAQKPNV